MQSGAESSSSERFNPVGRLQQSGRLGSYSSGTPTAEDDPQG